MALQENLAPKAEEMVEMAKTCSELLLQLINNILDSGKADLGKLEVYNNPTNIYDIASKVWGICSYQFQRKGLKASLEIAPEVPKYLMLDGIRLTQVLFNLIGNSVKFTDKGSVSVYFDWIPDIEKVSDVSFEPIPYEEYSEGRFEKSLNSYKLREMHRLSNIKKRFKKYEDSNHFESCKGLVKIIIKDTGSGMSKESLGCLFQRFSQVCKDKNKRKIGTGLGLYITKEIVNKMKGDIKAYSKEGVGSTFILCFPTFYSPSFLNESLTYNLEKFHNKRLRVLLADDSEFQLDLLFDYLSKISSAEIVNSLRIRIILISKLLVLLLFQKSLGHQ